MAHTEFCFLGEYLMKLCSEKQNHVFCVLCLWWECVFRRGRCHQNTCVDDSQSKTESDCVLLDVAFRPFSSFSLISVQLVPPSISKLDESHSCASPAPFLMYHPLIPQDDSNYGRESWTVYHWVASDLTDFTSCETAGRSRTPWGPRSQTSSACWRASWKTMR